MSTLLLRKQLQEQIDKLPDDLVEQIADFTHFVMKRLNLKPEYADWDESQWESFAINQFFKDEDEVEYTLNDAQEVCET